MQTIRIVKPVVLVIFLVLSAGDLSGQTRPAGNGKRRLTLDDLFQFQNLTAAVLAPDGESTLFMVQRADVPQNSRYVNLWISNNSGETRQLTTGMQVDENPRWSPDSHWIAFKSDRAAMPEGVARHQIWLVPATGGEARQLTREKFDIRTLEWAPDGKYISIIAGQSAAGTVGTASGAEVVGMNSDQSCIYLISVPDGTAKLLYKSERPITTFSFSPKGDAIVFADQPNWREAEGHFHSEVKVVSLADRHVTTLSGGALSSSGPLFSPDGEWVAFQGGPQKNWIANHPLYVAPVAGGPARRISESFDEDIEQYQWAADSRSLYFTGARGMDTNLYRASLDGHVTSVYEREGIVSSISVAGSHVAFIHRAPEELPNVYLLDSRDSKQEAKRLTDLNTDIDGVTLGKIQTIRWKSKKDGLLLEGQLLTPPDYQPGRKYPLLVVLHGGPNGRFDNGFVLDFGVYPVRIFSARGYAVFMPNPRGSNGYGQNFREMAVKDWGGGDFEDVQSGVDELIAKGIANKDRMGIMGWSYGGYLTAWTIAHTNRFRAASIGAGPVDLFTMYGGTDIPEFMETYFGGSPWTARELYFSRSPLAYAKNIRTPALILHGADDGRVPPGISYELLRTLQASGVECQMFRYPDSGHGIGSLKLVRDAFERNLDWFDRWIGPAR